MIYGIGTDIVEIARIESALSRHGERFARKLLSDEEWQEFLLKGQAAAWLAKRFAAKEAFAKALGTGIRGEVTLPRIAVRNDALGRPVLVLDARLLALLDERKIRAMHLSLSDERQFACAFVVLET